MRASVVVVDMIVDNLHSGEHSLIAQEGAAIIPALQRLLAAARASEMPVVFANDSFLPQDALFGGRMKPHALRGTAGAQVIPELAPKPGDHVVPKRRFSAFYKTDLAQTLRTLGVDTVAIGGITTPFCVLTTALDAVCEDFRAVILEDCAAAHKREVHERCLSLYRKNILWPLLRVMRAQEFLAGD